MAKYKFGCLMLKANKEAMHMTVLHLIVEKEDLYESDDKSEYGFENDPHVTILFGFHDDGSKEYPIRVFGEECLNKASIDIKIKKASVFTNDEFDVLKLDVESSQLEKINKHYATNYAHTNTFDYHPHMTLAYLKSGTGAKYAKLVNVKLKELKLIGKELSCDELIYSRPNHKKTKKKMQLKETIQILKFTDFKNTLDRL